jgi:hypothetical protein
MTILDHIDALRLSTFIEKSIHMSRFIFNIDGGMRSLFKLILHHQNIILSKDYLAN